MQSNIPPKVLEKINKNLHLKKNHPIEIIKNLIYQYFKSAEFATFDDMPKFVSTVDNFDQLLIPKGHPARSKSDTYYQDENTVLRTHTSAHQAELLSKGYTNFLVTGDVYRKDEIDRCHYPIFHQMEGVCLVEDGQDPEEELKKTLIGLINYLFPGCDYRFNDDYFPFTEPSFEMEVKYQNSWLEILGCGIIQPKILENAGMPDKTGWAFGLGLERLAMILFEIPDIRYFWSDDPKFLEQFSEGKVVKFIPYSPLDPITRDMSFWIYEKDLQMSSERVVWNYQNDFYELCREYGEDMIERIELFDTFYHKNKQRYSQTYHIMYSPPNSQIKDPAEFVKLVNKIHGESLLYMANQLNIEIR